MTDSENEVSNPNVFTFQNMNTTVSARGPNTNITNFSFRNQMTSTMYLPRNFERQRYAESVSDQRSIYYRRETSPMSIRSACDIPPRNYQQYYNGMSSHQSVFNGRSGSPVSMRSIDSSASVSAADIAFAFKNVKFNKYDLKVIKEAYHKLMKQRVRKRIEKRRNMRLFLKGSRNRSGDDSGEQGSDSSISSDDCRSVKTSYKENMSSSRSARMDLTDFRKAVKENNMLKDCSENFRQNNLKGMSVSTTNFNRNQNFNGSSISKQDPLPTQRERFKNGFLLPSHRFNRSVASTIIPENLDRHQENTLNHSKQNDRINCASNRQPQSKHAEQSDSDEEIFSEVTVRENSNRESQGKRSLESDDDANLPVKKKSKISSPVKNAQANKKVPSKLKNINPVNKKNDNSSNFEFAKPTLPVKKSKPKIQEKVIAKSKQPLTGFVEPISNIAIAVEPVQAPHGKSNDDQIHVEQSELSQNSDVSMRPSFIKRKLFTQKLDVADKANLSSDGLNSPQNIYSALQKEKNKSRKLVTNQSCLNREVQDDNNLLDLIHKIVPPDQMNATNQTSINQINNSNKKDDDDRWDVTSVISMCNDKDVSDTFTDEEIFANDRENKNTKADKKKSNINPHRKDNIDTNTKTLKGVKESDNVPKQCKVVIEKLHNKQALQKLTHSQNTSLHTQESKSLVKNFAKTFWDTDFESDAESQVPTKQISSKENQATGPVVTEAPHQEFKHPVTETSRSSPISKNHVQVPNSSRWLNSSTKNVTVMNNTLDNTRKFNITSLSVRTHRTSTKKKCCTESCLQETIPKPRNNNKIPTKPDINSRRTSKPDINTVNNGKLKSKSDVHDKDAKNKVNQASIESNKKSVNNDPKAENKTSVKKVKAKSNTQNTTKSRSTSRTRKSPKESKSKTEKQTKSPRNLRNQQSPKGRSRNQQSPNGRPIRSCRTPSQNRSLEYSRSSLKFTISPLKITTALKRNKCHKENSFQEMTSRPENNNNKPTAKANLPSSNEANTNSVSEPNMKKGTQNKPSTKVAKTKPNTESKSKSTVRMRNSPKKSKSKVDKQVSKNISNYKSPVCDRPIRTCRTPNYNRSLENYKSTVKRR